MSINGISSATGISAVDGADRHSAPGADASPAAALQGPDPTTPQPAPARFPWLSRLSRELETAAQQPAAFAAAPALGDHLDQSA